MAVEMGILHTANVILLRYLLKKGFENMIPKELSHYFEEGDHNQVLYYRVSQDKKAGVQDTRVAETIREMLLLQEALGRNFTPSFLSGLPEYQIFQRVLEEQTRLDDAGNRVPKDKKEIPADSVQNPFDATMTYRYKRRQHHGHVLNVAEVIDGKGNGIVVHASVGANTQSENGEEAWQYITKCKNAGTLARDVHLLITDIEMPLMDGHRLTKLVKTDDATKDIPVIIFSSLVNDEMRRKGEELGADAQLSKPEIGNLVKVIDNLLNR